MAKRLDFEYLSMYREETIPRDLLDQTPKHLNGGYWVFTNGPRLIEWEDYSRLRVYRFVWGAFYIAVEFIALKGNYLVTKVYISPWTGQYTILSVKNKWHNKLELKRIYELFNENTERNLCEKDFINNFLKSGYFYIDEVERIIAELGIDEVQVGYIYSYESVM